MAASALKMLVVLQLLCMLAVLVRGQDGKCPCPSGQCCSNAGFCGTSDAYCGKGNCKSQCPKKCFPGDAMVYTPAGEKKFMTDLVVGDKVAVSTNGKDITYEEIYAFGHKDAEVTADYLQLNMKDQDDQAKSLELSGLHFVPTISSKGQVVFKRAQDVEVGDTMMATNASLEQAFPYTVTEILAMKKQGLYNPYTMGGTIIVNGVVASAHSEWFLDGIFDAFSLTHWLPAAYQAVLSPARFLYTMLGTETYAALYKSLDARVDIAKSGTEYGGGIIAVATLIGMLGFYGLASMNKAKSK